MREPLLSLGAWSTGPVIWFPSLSMFLGPAVLAVVLCSDGDTYRTLAFLSAAYVVVVVVLVSRLLRALGRYLSVVLTALVTVVALPAPWIGRRLEFKTHPVRALIEHRVGEDIVDFRDRLMQLMRAERMVSVSRIPDERRREIILHREAVQRRHRNGEFVLTLLGGAISVGLTIWGELGYIAVVLGLYLLIIPVSVALRIAISDLIMFDSVEVSQTRSTPKLWMMYAWNTAIAEAPTKMLAGPLLLGLLKGEFEPGYNLGWKFISEVAMGREVGDAYEEMVMELFGEEVSLPQWIKRRLDDLR